MAGIFRHPWRHPGRRVQYILRGSLAAAPGVPANVNATPGVNAIVLIWETPLTGGAVDHYDVDRDGGATIDVGLTFAHAFTGLIPETSHTVRVRAVNAYGTSAWVTLSTATLAGIPLPIGRTIRVDLEDRTYTVDTEPRTLRVPAEDRTLHVTTRGER